MIDPMGLTGHAQIPETWRGVGTEVVTDGVEPPYRLASVEEAKDD